MGRELTVAIVPIGKPRMTQRDRWKKRPCVLKYRAFADELRAQTDGMIPEDPVSVSWVAWFPFPKSYSKKKRAALAGTIHRQKPDRDNVDKAILDVLFKEDCRVGHGELCKRWDDGKGPRIELRFEITEV